MTAATTQSDLLIPIAEQRLARSALRRLSRPNPDGKGRLLYLVGPAGCGKSALLTEFSATLPETQAPPLRVTASEFAAQLAEASVARQIVEFQEHFRAASLLICEDLQALEERRESLQQLQLILDDLAAQGVDVVVSSTKLPSELEGFPPKLLNRFRGGTILEVTLPQLESRVALLRHFSRRHRLSMTHDALLHLADAATVSPRELDGFMFQLSKLGRPLKQHDIESFLASDFPLLPLSLSDICRAVAREFALPVSALRSRRRSHALVLPRQCAMWLCRVLCHASYPQIGRYFARQHSSVIHAVRLFETRLENDPALRHRLARVKSSCR
jgi:chromosomal replication initiator protein